MFPHFYPIVNQWINGIVRDDINGLAN